MSFLAHQGARGIEIESAVAVPFMIWRLAGWHGSVVYEYGAWQLSGEYAGLARDASRLSLILIATAVTAWCVLTARGRIRWRPEFAADAPLAVTLLVLVASPVLSPQYMLWAIGLAAACLAAEADDPAAGRAGHPGRRPAHRDRLPHRMAEPCCGDPR